MDPEFRVFLLEKCVINPVPEPKPPAKAKVIPLLDLFAPKLIEMAIGGVATLLKKAGQDETVHVAGHEFADFYVADAKQALQVNKKIGCILGVCGAFGGKDTPPAPADDPAVQVLVREKLVPKNSVVRIIFEAAVRATADQTAFFLDTRHFSVRDFIGDSGKSERAFVVTLSVTVPGATADGDTIALGNIDLGRLKRGADLVPGGRPLEAYPRFRSNLMPWKQISQASKSAYDADVAAGKAAGRSYMPVAFHLSLSETTDGNKFLLTLGELLDGAKQEAATEISKLILPEKRAEAEAARAEAAEKLYEAELEAELALREARKAYEAGAEVDKPALRVKLEMAKRTLERKTRLREAAGLPARPPVPDQ